MYFPFSWPRILTPYYSEDVLFSMNLLEKPNEDGVSILFYLQKIFPGFSFLDFLLDLLRTVEVPFYKAYNSNRAMDKLS